MYTLFIIMHALIIYVHFLQFRSEEVPSSNFIRSRVYIKHMISRWRTGKESTRQIQIQSLCGGRSPGEGNGNPLQDSCLGNPMDRGAWQVIVHGVAKSRT